MQANVKGGFNRLFIVLTAIWAVYCLVLYPAQRRSEALKVYSSEYRNCYDIEHHQENPKDCARQAQELWQTTVDQWSAKNFYIQDFWLLLVIVVVLPIVFYGFCRGLAGLTVWVWSGFSSPS
jgi:hypothetical protein